MISFRDLTAADKEKIRSWRNLPEIRKYMYTDHVIGVEEHEAWFNRTIHDDASKYWIIVCDGEDVGLVNLYGIDRRNQRCYWAFYVVSPNVRGKGVGTAAEYFVLQTVFDELKLNKLCCEVLDFNQGVVRMHKSFGFVQEGLFRKHVMKGGEAHDVVCLSLLKQEWEASREALLNKLKDKGLA
jgi:UDP-4-amino-4,6-dideoxy-N-acetyl-beta-L-altrosamine N-acetyltransferase